MLPAPQRTADHVTEECLVEAVFVKNGHVKAVNPLYKLYKN